MKKRFFVLALALALSAAQALSAQAKILYVYDEVNDQSKPYIGWFKTALEANGIAYDEATAMQAAQRDLSQYRLILAHGMVMAFDSKSPVRDWLKAERRLAGKPVALFVTANRWFLDKLTKELRDLLDKDGATTVDALSTATKKLDVAGKQAAVNAFVAKLK